MNPRYQPPDGDIFLKLRAQYGDANARKIAAADASGGVYAVNQALAEVRSGLPLATSTLKILADQVTTDVLAAPLDSANRQIGNAVKSFFRSPWVIAAIVAFAFVFGGGLDWLKKQFKA